MGILLDDGKVKAGFGARYKLQAFQRGWTKDGQGNVIGELLWEEVIHNIVPTVGLIDMLDKYWKGSSYTAAFSVGLTSTTPTVAAANTMASHAGWTEVTAYDEATREALVLGTVVASGDDAVVDNSASRAEFTISTNGTGVGGAFIATGTGHATKGATTGTLVSVAAFVEGNRTLNDGDLLRVLVEIEAASA